MGFEFGQIILQQKTKAPEETLRGLFSSCIKKRFRPLEIREISIFNVQGYEISLPVTFGQLRVYYEDTKPKLKDMERDNRSHFEFSRKNLYQRIYKNLENRYIRLIGNKLQDTLKRNHIKFLAVGKYEQKAVKSLLWNEMGMIQGEYYFCQGSIIRRMFLPQWLERVCQVHGLQKAQLRLMVNDDEHLDRLDTFVGQLSPELNHLLIITKRRRYFQDIAAWLLKENGLVVEMADTLGPGTGQGHILIDFNCDNHKDYQWYPKNLIVMPVKELALNKEFLGMRRRDVCVEEGEFLVLDGEKRSVVLSEAAYMKTLEEKGWRKSLFFTKKDATIIDT